MKTKTELKTIHDLPKSMKEMYDIRDGIDCINSPCFVSLKTKDYSIATNGITHTIYVEESVVITLWNKVENMHITIL